MGRDKAQGGKLKNKILKKYYFNYFIQKKNTLFDWIEFHPWKTIVALYFFFVFIKLLLLPLSFDRAPLTDQFYYLEMARCFLHSSDFYIAGVPSHHYPPLYAVLISPAFLFKDMNNVFLSIGIINVLISSTILFPAFLLSKEFFNEKKSLLLSILIFWLPWNINMMFNIRAENLYFPLFLITFYLIYKTILKKDDLKYTGLSGIFVGLCFLTRLNTIALIASLFFIFIFYYAQTLKENKLKSIFFGVKNWIFLNIFAFFTVLPWFLRNGFHFGFTPIGILGYSSEIKHTLARFMGSSNIKETWNFLSDDPLIRNNPNLVEFHYIDTISNLLIQFFVHNGFVILASGIICFMICIVLFFISYKKRKNRLFLFSLSVLIISEFYILLTAWHNGNQIWTIRCHRYNEPVVALIIILGFIGIFKYGYNFLKDNKFDYNKKIFISSILTFLPLLFFLNIVEISIGANYIKRILNTEISPLILTIIGVIFILITIYISTILISNKKYKKYIILIIVSIIFTTGTVSTYRDFERREIMSNSDFIDTADLLNNRFSGLDNTIYFDYQSFFNRTNYTTNAPIYWILGGWINTEIKLGDYDSIDDKFSYLISLNKNESLSFETIKISSPYYPRPGYDYWEKNLYIYEINKS